MKREGKDIKSGKCIRDIYGRLHVNDNDRKRIWIQHEKKIINEVNDWDQMTNADVVLGSIEKVT